MDEQPKRDEPQVKRTKPEGFIPKGEFIARTKNSLYRFGAQDQNGHRSIERADKPMGFKVCRILYLKLGEDMEFEGIDVPEDQKPDFWKTSRVVSITGG